VKSVVSVVVLSLWLSWTCSVSFTPCQSWSLLKMNLFLSVLRIMLELIDYLILIAPEFVVSALSMSLGNPALIRLSFPCALFFRMLSGPLRTLKLWFSTFLTRLVHFDWKYILLPGCILSVYVT
jgi:hypothetical protein